jgi:hypothetical protein
MSSVATPPTNLSRPCARRRPARGVVWLGPRENFPFARGSRAPHRAPVAGTGYTAGTTAVALPRRPCAGSHRTGARDRAAARVRDGASPKGQEGWRAFSPSCAGRSRNSRKLKPKRAPQRHLQTVKPLWLGFARGVYLRFREAAVRRMLAQGTRVDHTTWLSYLTSRQVLAIRAAG